MKKRWYLFMAVLLILNLWKLRRNSLKSVVVLMKWRSDKNSIKKKSPGQCCSGDFLYKLFYKRCKRSRNRCLKLHVSSSDGVDEA